MIRVAIGSTALLLAFAGNFVECTAVCYSAALQGIRMSSACITDNKSAIIL